MMNNNINWNDALGDLELLGDLEKNAIEAYINRDVPMYYSWIKAYFQKLCSMVDFDRKPFLERFKILQNNIWAGDSNNDGKLDEDEIMRHNAVLGQALEALEEIYFLLTSIKVKGGLSITPKVLAKEVQKRVDEEKAKAFPILER